MNNLHNINIERSVLSSILFNPATFEEVAAILSAKDFYLPSHRYLFEAMEACEREDLPIDEEFLKKNNLIHITHNYFLRIILKTSSSSKT